MCNNPVFEEAIDQMHDLLDRSFPETTQLKNSQITKRFRSRDPESIRSSA